MAPTWFVKGRLMISDSNLHKTKNQQVAEYKEVTLDHSPSISPFLRPCFLSLQEHNTITFFRKMVGLDKWKDFLVRGGLFGPGEDGRSPLWRGRAWRSGPSAFHLLPFFSLYLLPYTGHQKPKFC